MKKKRAPAPTKEQIAAQLKAQTERAARLKFIKEQFWPALGEACGSIEEAQMFLNGFNSVLMNEFLGLMKDKKFSEFDMIAKLGKEDERYEKQVKLLELFSDMNVFEAKGHIEGMKNEIDIFLQDERRKRPLATLHPTWLDEVAKIVNEE